MRKALGYSAKEHKTRVRSLGNEIIRLANQVDHNLKVKSAHSCPAAFASLQTMHYEIGRANADLQATTNPGAKTLRAAQVLASSAAHRFFLKCVVKK